MQSLLKDITEIKTGLTLRGPEAARRMAGKGLHLLRISDISPQGEIRVDKLNLIVPSPREVEKHRLHEGDIIMANRGSRMTSALFSGFIETIPSNQLFTIHLRNRNVLPEYLHWFLNQESAQAYIFSHARGSYVKTVSIGALGKLKVPIPPVERQSLIVELSRLSRQEKDLLRQVAEKRKAYLSASLMRMAHQE